MTSINGFTPIYDGVGNVTNDNLHAYTWDLYGRPSTIDSVGLTYDALGRLVEQNRSGTYTQMVYAPTGDKMQIMSGQTATKFFVSLPAGGQAVYNSGTLVYYGHPDHLGSTRFASTPSRTMYFDTAYAPFGEPYAQSGTADLSFTGQRQDTVAGLYDFPAREYSIQGRWPSPDPAGLAAVDPSNPQSWNRYAYLTNNPLALTDPSGLGPTCLLDEMGNCHGGGGGSCTIDGFAADCSMAFGLVQSGAGIQCNGCGVGTQAVLGPGGTTILQQWVPPSLINPANAGDPFQVTTGYWQTIGFVADNGGNSSWWGTFGKTFVNGVLHGDRQPGESFGACVARSANETTFGASGKVTAGALAATVAVGAAVGSLSQIPSPWANSASTITDVVGQMTGQTPNPITLTLAGTLGGFAARSLGAGFGTTRLAISAAAGLSEGAAVGTTVLAGAAIGLTIGSAINCR